MQGGWKHKIQIQKMMITLRTYKVVDNTKYKYKNTKKWWLPWEHVRWLLTQNTDTKIQIKIQIQKLCWLLWEHVRWLRLWGVKLVDNCSCLHPPVRPGSGNHSEWDRDRDHDRHDHDQHQHQHHHQHHDHDHHLVEVEGGEGVGGLVGEGGEAAGEVDQHLRKEIIMMMVVMMRQMMMRLCLQSFPFVILHLTSGQR